MLQAEFANEIRGSDYALQELNRKVEIARTIYGAAIEMPPHRLQRVEYVRELPSGRSTYDETPDRRQLLFCIASLELLIGNFITDMQDEGVWPSGEFDTDDEAYRFLYNVCLIGVAVANMNRVAYGLRNDGMKIPGIVGIASQAALS